MKSSRFLVLVALQLGLLCVPVAAQERLLLTTMSPPNTLNDVFFKPWSERVNAQSNGTLAIELRSGLTLANRANIYDRVQDDTVQIGWLLHGAVAGQFPLSDVGSLPFLVNNGEEASVALWRLYRSGLLNAEYRNLVPLMFGVFPQNEAHFAGAPRSLDSLAGLKMGVNSKLQSDIVRRLGGAPVSVQIDQLYEALQRGTIDGTIIGWGAFPGSKLGEATNYHIEVPLGSSTTSLFMTRKRFDALPAAARKALEDNTGEAGSWSWGKFFDDAPGRPVDGKRTVVKPTAEQQAEWQRRVTPVLDEWVAGRPDGRRTLAVYRSVLTQVRAEASR